MLVCSKLFTVTCLVTCSSWAGIDNKIHKIEIVSKKICLTARSKKSSFGHLRFPTGEAGYSAVLSS